MNDERDMSVALSRLPFAKRAPRAHTFRPRKQVRYPDPAIHYPGVAFSLATIDDSDLAAIAKFKCSEIENSTQQDVYDMMDSIRSSSRRSPRRRIIRASASVPMNLHQKQPEQVPERRTGTPTLCFRTKEFAKSAPVKREPRRIVVKRKG